MSKYVMNSRFDAKTSRLLLVDPERWPPCQRRINTWEASDLQYFFHYVYWTFEHH